MEAHGVKETKEAVLALVILGKFVAVRLKDGLDLSDAAALASKMLVPEFKDVVMAGVEGLEKVPAELSELSMAEIFELAQVIPQVLAELQKA